MTETPAPKPLPSILGVAVPDFRTASHTVLEFLQSRIPFSLWMVTRADVEEEHLTILLALDHSYGLSEGDMFGWSDSLCARMVAQLGPRVAPRLEDVPAYAEAPITKILQIRAYIGVPIVREDGSLFGTICAMDPDPKPPEIVNEQPLIELFAGLLGKILSVELKEQETQRRAEHAEAESLSDQLTGVANRRGWERLLDAEEARCARYGDPASVVVLDLNEFKEVNDTRGHEAGDELLRTTAQVLQTTARTTDLVARLGGDEFGILAVGCGAGAASILLDRLNSSLQAGGVSAAVGVASRHPTRGLHAAWEEADAAMYRAKP